MSDPDARATSPGTDAGTDSSLALDMGRMLPPGAPERLPVLTAALPSQDGSEPAPAGSTIAHGLHFNGVAQIAGPCSIAGEFEGLLMQAAGAPAVVVVTETGRVKGEVTAHRISVRGQVEGTLDAGGGEVALHDGARIQGKVRYGRIQVNGADLNATLERVAAPAPAPSADPGDPTP